MAEAFKCDRCGNLIEGKSPTSEPILEAIESFQVSIRIGRQITEKEKAQVRAFSLGSLFGVTKQDEPEEDDKPIYKSADFCRPCFNEVLVKALRLREMQAIGEAAL